MKWQRQPLWHLILLTLNLYWIMRNMLNEHWFETWYLHLVPSSNRSLAVNIQSACLSFAASFNCGKLRPIHTLMLSSHLGHWRPGDLFPAIFLSKTNLGKEFNRCKWPKDASFLRNMVVMSNYKGVRFSCNDVFPFLDNSTAVVVWPISIQWMERNVIIVITC